MKSELEITIDLGDGSRPVYRQIADAIRVRLVEGAVAPGERLPTVRAMAAELGVHFNTVAEAYRQLAEEGWLEMGRRRGATVVDKTRPNRVKTDSRQRFYRRLRELLAQGKAEGLKVGEMAEMSRKILES